MAGRDLLIARDLTTGSERVVTDLTGDGSSGWDIEGYALSPDRRRIAIASLYGPTAADTATGLATRAIWTLAADGTDFRRLTPTFPNTGGGKQSFSISVSDPEWAADGSQVVYTYGEYWWENLSLKGNSVPWRVAAVGGQLPSLFPVAFGCSVLYPSRNPATGQMLFVHSVCVPSIATNGLFLYPATGGSSPAQLVASSRAADGIDVSLAKPAWFTDGSGFLFVAGSAQTNWVSGLFVYDVAQHTAALLVAPAAGTSVDSVAVSRDMTKIVYGLRRDADSSGDLHLIDLSAPTPVDVALTTDGKSFSPAF
jgi:Tol biopolymer transport system component